MIGTDNLDAKLDAKLDRLISEGIGAYVWRYYRDNPDATTVDRDTIMHLNVLLDSLNADVNLDELVTKAENEFNETFLGIAVGPTYDEDGELI